ncbi:SEL1-like repeat protein, partial [Roseibium sp.]
YQKAVDLGLAPAEYRLASLYEKGRGVEKDLEKARELYTKAAEAGNAKAMHNLAVLYAEGADGAPDFAKAGKWFESAANYGVKDSLFNLGILYARGLGVEKDLVASYKWFAIAADQGDRDAAKKRDDVANMMDQETLAAARLAVETFKLKTPDPVANKVATDPEWAAAGDLSTNASISLGNVVDYEGMVREAQTRLNQLGFETGTPDGQMGPRTRSAIRAFQRSIGMVETGDVDADLIKELESQSI